MKTSTKVKKWGNSLAIRIPLSVAQNLGLQINSQIQITSDGTTATLKPESPKKLKLQDLLDKVTPENTHGLNDWGTPVGKELW